LSNSYLTIDMVTREALRVAHEQATFVGTVDRSYDDSFAKTGGKIGSTLRIRQPNQYSVRTSGRVMDVQDQAEANTTITVATQYGVDMRFHSDELSLSIDDFSERYISPAVKRLVSKVDSACIETATKATYNTVGSAGTVVGASGDISAIHNARARLNQMLAPKDGNRALQMDSVTMASVANGLKALFMPDKDVSKAFREGLYARTAMADIYENERTLVFTNGSDVTGTTDAAAAVTDGGTTLSADTASPVTYTVGTVFTIAGVYACHPETKQSLGYLQQFTNTAGTGSGGDMTISPATVLTGAKQNVCKSDSTALATTDFNSQTLTAVGLASTAYRQNLMYHKEAFAFVTADLPLMADSESCVRRTQDGISLRVWKGADIVNDRLLLRIDLLWGFAAIRPEWSVRVTN
jgi:hypothetical protein